VPPPTSPTRAPPPTPNLSMPQIIEEVQITEQLTLEGLIDKIFDKALTDTHFSELYAKMCKAISQHPDTPKVGGAGGSAGSARTA